MGQRGAIAGCMEVTNLITSHIQLRNDAGDQVSAIIGESA